MFKLFVRAIIEDEKGDFLYVEKNEKQKIAPWKSLLPWWSIEFSEIPEEALKREVFEETWLEVIETKIFWTKTIIIWEEHWLGVYYTCKTKNLNFENKEPEKHKSVYFLDKKIFLEKF